MKGRKIMLNNIVLATTAEFKNMNAKERVDIFCKFTKTTNELTGEMLEIMFQSKDYQDLGYNNWNIFVTEQLPIGLKQSLSARKAYKNLKIPETENLLKAEEVDAIEAEIEETEFEPELLSRRELQEIKDKYVPKSHHKSIKDATPEEIVTMQRRVEESGKKNHWKYYIVSDEVFAQYVDEIEQSTHDGTKRINVDLHTLEGLYYLLVVQGRDIDQKIWLKDKIREVRKAIVELSGNNIAKKAKVEAEGRRIDNLPALKYENFSDLARKCAELIASDDSSINHFVDVLRKEYKTIISRDKE